MKNVLPYRHFIPKIAEEVFIADTARVIGEVEIGARSSIWYQAVLRGDVGLIRIGEATSIQDGAIVHCTYQRSTTLVGDRVVVGHGAMLHGCLIEEEVLVGMGAIILDNAEVPKHTVIAAGALVPEGKILESGFVYAGVPAKKIKALEGHHLKQIHTSVQRYIDKGQWYAEHHGTP